MQTASTLEFHSLLISNRFWGRPNMHCIYKSLSLRKFVFPCSFVASEANLVPVHEHGQPRKTPKRQPIGVEGKRSVTLMTWSRLWYSGIRSGFYRCMYHSGLARS